MSLRQAGSGAMRVPILLLVLTVILTISCSEAERVVDEAKSRLGDPPPTFTPPPAGPGPAGPGTPVAEMGPTFTPPPAGPGPAGPGTPVAGILPPFHSASDCSLSATCAVIPGVITFHVGTTDDEVDAIPGNGICLTSSGSCSLRAAIQEANALSPNNVYINLSIGTHELTIPAGPIPPCSTGTCVFSGNENSAMVGDLDITGNVCIEGRDRDLTVISVMNRTVGRVFDVATGAHVCLLNLTITNGYAPPLTGADPINAEVVLPDCENNPDDCDGGGIRNRGDLHLHQVIVESNASNDDGNGIANFSENLLITDSIIRYNQDFLGHGGGIYSATSPAGGSAIVERSTIRGNTTDLGGGISSFTGNLILTNVTVSDNEAGHFGAGVSKFAGGDVYINASTIFDNQINNADGAGVFSVDGGTIHIKNSIVANTSLPLTPGPNCLLPTLPGGNINPLGSNISDGPNCVFAFSGTNPNLDPLAVYTPPGFNVPGVSGPPPTHRLMPSSPAIDAADPCEDHTGNSITMDGRTSSRPPFPSPRDRCDIGAHEN